MRFCLVGFFGVWDFFVQCVVDDGKPGSYLFRNSAKSNPRSLSVSAMRAGVPGTTVTVCISRRGFVFLKSERKNKGRKNGSMPIIVTIVDVGDHASKK